MENLKQATKRALAVVMIAVLLIGLAPLSGFAETDWSEFALTASASSLSVTNVKYANLHIDGKLVKSIGIEKVTIVEGTNGYMIDSNYFGEPIDRPYFYYEYIEPSFVTVFFDDNTSMQLSYDDFEDKMKTNFDCYLGCYSVDQDKETPWGIGKHSGWFGNEGTFSIEYVVEIVESNIESIEVKDVILIKDYSSESNFDWIYDDDGEEIFVEWSGYSTRPVMLKINYKDGTSKECTYDALQDDTDFYCYYHDNQSYDNQWNVGEYSAYLDFGVQTYEYSVIIGELKEIKAYPIEIVEGTKGAYHSYSYAGETYYFGDFIYNYDLFTIYNLTFQDGKNAELNYTELENLGSINRIDTQWDENWGIGKHVGNVSLYTYDENEEDDIEFYSIEVDVKIIETPIDRIAISPLFLTEGIDGELSGYGNDFGEFFYFAYDYVPRDITIFYKNGTSVTGSLTDFEDEENDIMLSYYTVGSASDESWLPGNTYKAAAIFMGVKTEYNINILANTSHTHLYTCETIEATCEEYGCVIYTCSCGKKYSEIIYAEGHIDENGDNICEVCGENCSDSDFEDDYTLAETGQCGENVFWNYDCLTGELVISGEGAMYDYDIDGGNEFGCSPFCCNTEIKTVVVKEGVTTIGGQAFYECESLTSIRISDSVTSIGRSAFAYCDSLTDVYYGGSEGDWNEISIGEYNECLTNATIHFAKGSHTHTYTAKTTKAATCTTAGTKTYTCSCGDSYTEEIKATGKHTGGTATCKAKAICTVCKQPYGELAKHKEVTVAGTPATYTTEGKTEGKKCSVCGTVTVAQQTIAKLTLGKVSGLKAKKVKVAKKSEITLSWTSLGDGVKYEVYVKNGKKWTKLTTTSKTSYTVKKDGKKKALKADKEYQFRVRAVVDDVKGKYSSNLKVKTSPSTATLKLKAGKKQLTASWSKVSDISGYEVQYSTSKKMKSAKTEIAKKSAKKTTIKKLKKGKKYYARIRTYKTVDGKKIYSDWSKVKNVKVK